MFSIIKKIPIFFLYRIALAVQESEFFIPIISAEYEVNLFENFSIYVGLLEK